MLARPTPGGHPCDGAPRDGLMCMCVYVCVYI